MGGERAAIIFHDLPHCGMIEIYGFMNCSVGIVTV